MNGQAVWIGSRRSSLRTRLRWSILAVGGVVTLCVAGCGQDILSANAEPVPAVVVEHDVALLIKVKNALVAEPELRPFGLDVGVQGGVVTLYGEVATREQRDKAEHIARSVRGVALVKSGIAVTQSV